ncbi:hypothetical protein CEXT_704011 [Caerostris extrusa]|uniref:Uncharacterized protein n=1 Tax=Caerostris extrusa TaxID=172846 RepID=A0AAV4VK57_CAEEX|nr:hypothetical protein CEXT_704011 [Caerostris extrusa]
MQACLPKIGSLFKEFLNMTGQRLHHSGIARSTQHNEAAFQNTVDWKLILRTVYDIPRPATIENAYMAAAHGTISERLTIFCTHVFYNREINKYLKLRAQATHGCLIISPGLFSIQSTIKFH